jgi:hypothetical protein
MLQCYVLMCGRSVTAFLAPPRSQRPGQGPRSPHPKAGPGWEAVLEFTVQLNATLCKGKVVPVLTRHVMHIAAAVFFVYCVIVFTAVIFAKSNSPMCSCNDTVVNWFIREQFCNLHVWFMFIRAIYPLKKKTYCRGSGSIVPPILKSGI